MKRILVIIDEKKSSLNQCNALLSEYKKGRKIKVKYKVISKRLIHYLPNLLIYYLLFFRSLFEKFFENNYDFIISCGRISAPYSLLFKKKNKCQNLHILDPYFLRKKFDLIILPSHDTLSISNSNNIIRITGTFVNKKDPSKEEILRFRNLSNKKIVTCFIGGDGKSSKFSETNAIDCVRKINRISNEYCIVYCFSRRTSKTVKNIIESNKKKEHLFFEYDSVNPYWYLIKKSEFFIVTEDSVSMISDATSTGKPVYIQEIDYVKVKIRNFVSILEDKGFVRSFKNGELKSWVYKPLDESMRVSKIIKNTI